MKRIFYTILIALAAMAVQAQTEDLSITNRWYTHNTSSDNTGKWTKIAECEITGAWQDFASTFELLANSGGDSRMYYGKLVTRFKNQSSAANPINYSTLTLLNSNLGTDNVKAVRNDLKVEVFIRIPSSHTRFYFRALVNGASAMTPMLTQNFHTELPSGDLVIDCTSGETNLKALNLTDLKVNDRFSFGESTANKIELATMGWSGSHGILFNAYKEVYQDGWLGKNTKYFNNVGSYGSGAGAIFFYGNGGTMDFCISPNSTGKGEGINWGDPKLRISRNGNIAIGKSTADAKLDVAGNIKAQEIEVALASMHDLQLNGTLQANNITYTTNGQTADHVFSDTYQLRDLTEVEAFITTNKHLPDVPSAAQMEAEGVNLAEMNKLLLQKVEELTLYAIELEKARSEEIEARENLVKQLEIKDREMNERLSKLEALLKQSPKLN